ncbi:MAG: endonuclease/exonuclease/phosphatase family protein [Halioglobus sp.]
MQDTLTIAAATLLALSLLPLWRHPHWLVRAAGFARLQLFYAALACLAMAVFFFEFSNTRGQAVMLCSLAATLVNLYHLAPFSSLWSTEVEEAAAGHENETLCILTANVLMTNRQAPKLLALVDKYQPDLLVALESDQWWQEQLDVLDERMPHSIKCPLDNLYGMHLYSRLPLEDTEICFLVEDDVPSFHAQLRLQKGGTVRLHVLHPAPPAPKEKSSASTRDAELIVVARELEGCSDPVIVAGDFNDVPWSYNARLLRRLGGLLDPRVGRGMFNTFHAGIPLMRWPLDHLYHSEHFQLLGIKRLPGIGSDHFPLLTRLALTAADNTDNEPPTPNKGDHSRADEVTARENALREEVPSPGTPQAG